MVFVPIAKYHGSGCTASAYTPEVANYSQRKAKLDTFLDDAIIARGRAAGTDVNAWLDHWIASALDTTDYDEFIGIVHEINSCGWTNRPPFAPQGATRYADWPVEGYEDDES